LLKSIFLKWKLLQDDPRLILLNSLLNKFINPHVTNFDHWNNRWGILKK